MSELAVPADELLAVFGPTGTEAVSMERIYDPTVSATRGIWRVRVGESSAVLKVIGHSASGHAHWLSGDEPDHWLYWQREALAYRSGMLDDLPGGLRAPTCLHLADRNDGTIAMWLDDERGTPATEWTIDRYGVAARYLGHMQGVCIGRTLPSYDWLSRGWLREYLNQRDDDLTLVGNRELWRHPLLAPWFPTPPIERLMAMRRDQLDFLDVLGALPRTLCHLDVHPGNLFADTDDTTVAIDWAFMGIGAIGEDAGNLVPDSVLDFHIDPTRIQDLDAALTTGYRQGLVESGWTGPPSTARLGMTATIAAKYAWIAPAMRRDSQ